MAGCTPPKQTEGRRELPSWLAAPLFVFGVFLISYVAMLPYVPPAIRLLLSVPGMGLILLGWRPLRAPLPTAIFWGGVFWAFAARLIHPAAVVLGGMIAAVGGILYLVKTRRRARS